MCFLLIVALFYITFGLVFRNACKANTFFPVWLIIHGFLLIPASIWFFIYSIHLINKTNPSPNPSPNTSNAALKKKRRFNLFAIYVPFILSLGLILSWTIAGTCSLLNGTKYDEKSCNPIIFHTSRWACIASWIVMASLLMLHPFLVPMRRGFRMTTTRRHFNHQRHCRRPNRFGYRSNP